MHKTILDIFFASSSKTGDIQCNYWSVLIAAKTDLRMDSTALQSLMFKEYIFTFILRSMISVPVSYGLLHLGGQRTAKSCQFCSSREK